MYRLAFMYHVYLYVRTMPTYRRVEGGKKERENYDAKKGLFLLRINSFDIMVKSFGWLRFGLCNVHELPFALTWR